MSGIRPESWFFDRDSVGNYQSAIDGVGRTVEMVLVVITLVGGTIVAACSATMALRLAAL